MIHLRKHIALLLFGIFFLPIIFHGVHIVWHHSHGDKYEHEFCYNSETDNISQINIDNISNKGNICPICVYQFSINDLPEISFFSSDIPEIAFVYYDLYKSQHWKQVFSDIPPRAPPVIIS